MQRKKPKISQRRSFEHAISFRPGLSPSGEASIHSNASGFLFPSCDGLDYWNLRAWDCLDTNYRMKTSARCCCALPPCGASENTVGIFQKLVLAHLALVSKMRSGTVRPRPVRSLKRSLQVSSTVE